jgi:predicted metalloprotease
MTTTSDKQHGGGVVVIIGVVVITGVVVMGSPQHASGTGKQQSQSSAKVNSKAESANKTARNAFILVSYVYYNYTPT